jgi:hypothetical protein
MRQVNDLFKGLDVPKILIDMSISKSVDITEGIRFQLRADFSNIFNHPMPSGVPGLSGRTQFPTAPNMNINSGNLGYYSDKAGNRTFQAMARIDF